MANCGSFAPRQHWPVLAEKAWPTLPEHAWPILADYPRPTLPEYPWPIIARKMTLCTRGLDGAGLE